MPFDIDTFATKLRENAHKVGFGNGECAKFVRIALDAGGADTSAHLVAAKTYGPVLVKNAFRELSVDTPETFRFMKGDIVVMEPPKTGRQEGHIAGYDGKNWISDFVQNGFWPGPAYRKERPAYVVYRR